MAANHITINVTQADINRAIKNHSARCVVAQAILRTVPTSKRVEVDMQTIRWTQDDQRLVWITPYRVQDYIIDFDAGRPIEPFKFNLRYDHRVTTPVFRRNEAAKKIDGAATKLGARRRRAAALKTELTEAKAMKRPRTEITRLAAEVKAAEARVAEGTEKLTELRRTEGPKAELRREGGERAKPMRRVNKTSTRHYGRRVMRINQEG